MKNEELKTITFRFRPSEVLIETDHNLETMQIESKEIVFKATDEIIEIAKSLVKLRAGESVDENKEISLYADSTITENEERLSKLISKRVREHNCVWDGQYFVCPNVNEILTYLYAYATEAISISKKKQAAATASNDDKKVQDAA